MPDKMKDEIRDIIKKIIAYHICNDIPKGIDKDKVDEALEQIEAIMSNNYIPKDKVLSRKRISVEDIEIIAKTVLIGKSMKVKSIKKINSGEILTFIDKYIHEIAQAIKDNLKEKE